MLNDLAEGILDGRKNGYQAAEEITVYKIDIPGKKQQKSIRDQ